MKIAVFSPKGGVGKTLLATALAYACHESGPHLLDIDTQRACSAYNWNGTGVQLTTCAPGAAAALLAKEEERLCIVDCGQSEITPGLIFGLCDTLLVPIEADYLSLRAAIGIQDEMARRFPSLDTRYVLTRYIPSRDFAREIRDAAREQWGESAFNALCKTMLPNSADFGKCAANGETVLQGAPDSNAGKTTLKLLRELAPIWNLPL